MASEPIPTSYAGILFRSKTEARYAKFFDGLDVKWTWEPQPTVTNGQGYSPDFMIFPALGPVWVEVKGYGEDPYSKDVMKFRRFAAERPGPISRCALFTGWPDERGNILVIGGDGSEDPVKGHWEDDTQEWRPCPSGHHFDLIWPGQFRGLVVEDGCAPSPGNPGEDRITRAVLAARNARFGVHEDPGSGTAG
jgi:hypothetical protein